VCSPYNRSGIRLASLDYGQERVYAAMARALVRQASGDYLGMADALGPWLDGSVLDGRSRVYAVLWRPLLVEGLIGSGQTDKAAAALDQLRADSGQVGYLRPALAWLEGWLTEQRGAVDEARRIYQGGEDSTGTGSPVYAARLLLAHGRLLRARGTGRMRSNACGGPIRCSVACGPRRSWPGSKRSWPRVIFPATGRRSSLPWR